MFDPEQEKWLKDNARQQRRHAKKMNECLLTKREVFAAGAMQALIKEGSETYHEQVVETWANLSVKYADALLAALEKS